MTVFMINQWYHTRIEHRNGQVTMRLSTNKEIEDANRRGTVLCGMDCLPTHSCGQCHRWPIDEDFRELMAIIKTEPKDPDQLWAIHHSLNEINAKLCRRYDWWPELSDKHWKHYYDREATMAMMKLRRKIGGDPAKAAQHGVSLVELEQQIAVGRARWDEYDAKMGWLEPRRMKQ
jgi:hypothetical protein